MDEALLIENINHKHVNLTPNKWMTCDGINELYLASM
jgi:hypothetical protein